MRRRTLASILFAIATFPVDYLVITLLPSVSIVLVIVATLALLAVAAYLWFSGKRETEPSSPLVQGPNISVSSEPIKNPVAKVPIPGWHPEGVMGMNLKPEFEQIWAVFFYPDDVPWEGGQRTPEKNMPRFKAVLNTKTKRAYWMLEYGMSLAMKREVQRASTTANNESEYQEWLRRYGYKLEPRPATKSDLSKKSSWWRIWYRLF